MKQFIINVLLVAVSVTVNAQSYLPTTGGTLSGNLILNGSLTGNYYPNLGGSSQLNVINHNPTMSANALYTSLRFATSVQAASTGNNSIIGIDSRILNQQNSSNTSGNFNPVSSGFYDQSGGFASGINVINYRAFAGSLSAGSNVANYVMYGGAPGPTTLDGTITNFTGFDLSYPYNNVTTNYYGVRINDVTGATIARAYSSTVSAGAGKYGLYFNGTANNFLNGNLGIGITSPLALLHVNGNVLIGAVTPGNPQNTNYLLDVKGSIRGNQITVNTTGADFVFEPSYKLKTLKEVESFILQNHHLPEVEPAIKMQTNGVNLGDNQTKLLQKIEELTLYAIEQNKKLETQQQKNEVLNNNIRELKRVNQEVSKRLETIENKISTY